MFSLQIKILKTFSLPKSFITLSSYHSLNVPFFKLLSEKEESLGNKDEKTKESKAEGKDKV